MSWSEMILEHEWSDSTLWWLLQMQEESQGWKGMEDVWGQEFWKRWVLSHELVIGWIWLKKTLLGILELMFHVNLHIKTCHLLTTIIVIMSASFFIISQFSAILHTSELRVSQWTLYYCTSLELFGFLVNACFFLCQLQSLSRFLNKMLM